MSLERSLRKNKPENNAPCFTERDRRILLGFLSEQLTHFETALDGVKNMVGTDTDIPMLAGMLRYYENCISAVRFMVKNAFGPQLSLMYLNTDTNLDRRDEWETQSKASLTQEQSDKSACSTLPTYPMTMTGNSPGSTSNENSAS